VNADQYRQKFEKLIGELDDAQHKEDDLKAEIE